jgi:hypothetical protein
MANGNPVAGKAAHRPAAIRGVEFQKGVAMVTAKVDDRHGELLPAQSPYPNFNSSPGQIIPQFLPPWPLSRIAHRKHSIAHFQKNLNRVSLLQNGTQVLC